MRFSRARAQNFLPPERGEARWGVNYALHDPHPNPPPFRGRGLICASFFSVILIFLISIPCQAQRVDNPVAEFAGLDKITARITKFDVKINETVQFGALQVTPRVCYNRAISDDPLTTGFVEVEEITLDNKIQRLFSGWMFADSPGLNAVEHPIYDIWLVSCKGGVQPKPVEEEAVPPTEEKSKPKAKKKQPKAEQEPEPDMLEGPPAVPQQLQPDVPNADPNSPVRQRHERRPPNEPQAIQPGVPFDPDQLPPE
jgi:hypothetical protein